MKKLRTLAALAAAVLMGVIMTATSGSSRVKLSYAQSATTGD